MGGEKISICAVWLDLLGSPPHGRGKGVQHSRVKLQRRITPAWAGKSGCGGRNRRASWDHPRMGGEKGLYIGLEIKRPGSPPHGRGKDLHLRMATRQQGITPAWAGKSRGLRRLRSRSQDHPRMGGEKLCGRYQVRQRHGSPPHGRGKESWTIQVGGCTRITPAWAGKRPTGRQSPVQAEDHPRMGGEKHFGRHTGFDILGSPPHGRGKDHRPPTGSSPSRITPAWAGKRLKRSHRSGIFISGPIPFHSVLHRPAGSGGSRAGRDGSPAGQPQNAGPA